MDPVTVCMLVGGLLLLLAADSLVGIWWFNALFLIVTGTFLAPALLVLNAQLCSGDWAVVPPCWRWQLLPSLCFAIVKHC